MDSHRGATRWPIGHVAALSLAALLALSGGWAPSAAGASEERASRGPKDERQECACPDRSPRHTGTKAEADPDDRPAGASRSDPAEADAPANGNQRPAAGSMGSSRTGDEGSSTSSGVRYDGRRGGAPTRPNGTGASTSGNETKVGGASGADGASSTDGAGDPDTAGVSEDDGAGSPSTGSGGGNRGSSGGSSVGGGSNRRRSSGGGGASTGGRGGGRGAGHGTAPRGGAGDAGGGSSGAGRGTGGPAGMSSGDPGWPAGFRFAPASPPRGRTGFDGGTGVPGVRWASFRAPGVVLVASPGIPGMAAAVPSPARAALAATGRAAERTVAGTPAGPLARTGEETSASVFLALMLILAGAVLRRTGRSFSLREQPGARHT